MKPLQPYHHAWLGAHPERSETWLRARLKDGFDVHHLDGDHANNDPLNLILIDSADHLMLHNGKTRVVRRPISRISVKRRDTRQIQEEMRILKRQKYAKS